MVQAIRSNSLTTSSPVQVGRWAGDVTNWTILGLIGGGSAGWVAMEIGHVFCFELGWFQFYPVIRNRLPEGLAIAAMQAGLGVTFGLLAAGILGTAHAMARRQLRLRGAVAWLLVGMSAGVLCWVTLQIVDRYLAIMIHTERVVWAGIWSLIGAFIGADVGAHWLAHSSKGAIANGISDAKGEGTLASSSASR